MNNSLLMIMIMMMVLVVNGQVIDEIWGGLEGIGSSCESGLVYNDGAASCLSAVDAGVCEVAEAQALETSLMPGLTEGPIGAAGQLALQVNHGLVNERQVTAILLGDGANGQCNYPASAHWRKGLRNGGGDQPCRDLYNATIPWSVATGADGGLGCGLVRSEDATHVLYDGTADVFFTEQLPGQRGALVAREVVSRLYFRLRFPKQVQASTELVQYADPRLLAAVTEQKWNPAELLVDMGLQLQLQAPFKVASWQMAGPPPAGIDAQLQGAPAVDCADESGQSACTQTWAATLTPQNGTCRLDGQYQFAVVLGCQTGVAPEDCPIDPENNPAVPVTATLASEDFCAVAETSVGATGQLSVHRSFDQLNFAFGDPQSAFFQDQLMHFRLQLEALDGFELEQSQIEEVRVEGASGNGTELLVYSRELGGAQNADWLYESQFNSGAAGSSSALHEHQFGFMAQSSVYGQVAQDSSTQSTVTVISSIQFTGNSASQPATRKRRIAVTRFPLNAGSSILNKRQLTNGAGEGAAEYLSSSAKFQMEPVATIEEEEGVEEFGGEEIEVKDTENDDGGNDGGDNDDKLPSWVPAAAAGGGAGLLACCMAFTMFAIFIRRRKSEENNGRQSPIPTQQYTTV